MTWVTGLIIFLGLVQLSHVAYARGIENFTDSQGTRHITNIGPKAPGSPAAPASPAAPPSIPETPPPVPEPEVQTPPPAQEAQAPPPPEEAPVPQPGTEAQVPPSIPESPPGGPDQVEPQTGSRVIPPEGSGGVMPAAHRPGDLAGLRAAAEARAALLQQGAWSPPRQAAPSLDGKIVIRRDQRGVIHITNVPLAEAPLMEPAVPAPALPAEAPAPALIIPAVQEVSLPELGPEVAAYLQAKLQGHSPVFAGQTVRCYRDPEGIWHIVDAPEPELQPPQAAAVASAEKITAPAAAPDPPVMPTPPPLAWGSGLSKPPTGAAAPTVVAQRDRRGVVHIFSRAAAESIPGRDSPVNFLGKISPALQSCIIEASQLYRLPVPLILALIQQESNFTHQAVSPKGAMGLMQLMPGTAALLGVRDPFDPRENILAGCRYFRQLLDYFGGNVPLALAGYNAGYNRVISAGCQVPAIKETQEFVTQVMGLYYLLERHVSGL